MAHTCRVSIMAIVWFNYCSIDNQTCLHKCTCLCMY